MNIRADKMLSAVFGCILLLIVPMYVFASGVDTTPTPTDTVTPTSSPTTGPTSTPNPTLSPTTEPTVSPTQQPTSTPNPTLSPTEYPTVTPTVNPTVMPQKPEVIVTAGISTEHGGTAQLTDFIVHVSGTNVVPAEFPAPDHPLPVTMDPGSYSVDITLLPGYSETMSGNCVGTILAGQVESCDIQITDSLITITPTVTPTCQPLPPCYFATPQCMIDIAQYCPSVTATPTPTNTPTPTPTSDGNNNCDGTNQSGINDNSNCNQQNQNQNQDQTQNNNQVVNINLSQNQQPQVLGTSSSKSLPSTGTPLEVWELLSGITPLGLFLRRIAKK